MSDTGRNWKRIGIACAASLGVHVVFAAFAHAPAALEASPVETPFRIHTDTAPVVHRSPKPVVAIRRPQPSAAPRIVRREAPEPAQAHGAQRRLRARPHLTVAVAGPAAERGPSSPGDEAPVTGPGPDPAAPLASPELATASPLATSEPAPSCPRPSAAARTLEIVEPDVPDDAAPGAAGSEATIRVDLSVTGAVTSATVVASTGDPRLDAAARVSALRTTYAPEIVECRARAGSYLFRVDFTG